MLILSDRRPSEGLEFGVRSSKEWGHSRAAEGHGRGIRCQHQSSRNHSAAHRYKKCGDILNFK